MPKLPTPRGGTWSATAGQTALDLEMRRSAKIPGPGKYDVSKGITADRVSDALTPFCLPAHCVSLVYRALLGAMAPKNRIWTWYKAVQPRFQAQLSMTRD